MVQTAMVSGMVLFVVGAARLLGWMLVVENTGTRLNCGSPRYSERTAENGQFQSLHCRTGPYFVRPIQTDVLLSPYGETCIDAE